MIRGGLDEFLAGVGLMKGIPTTQQLTEHRVIIRNELHDGCIFREPRDQPHYLCQRNARRNHEVMYQR